MQADRRDRTISDDTRRRHSTQTLITGIAVLILAAGAWLLAPGDSGSGSGSDGKDEAVETPVTSVPTLTPPRPDPAQAISEAPDIPESVEEPEPEPGTAIEDEPVAIETPARPAPPTPPLPDELDAQLRAAIAQEKLVLAPPLRALLAAPYMLDRAASSMDQLARGLVPRRALNLPRPVGTFPTQREGQTYRVDPAGYARYDTVVNAITALPPEVLATLFHRFRGALTSAYATLGYPSEAMDNTLIAALDAVIAAPVREEPPILRSKGALWAYDDAELESASDLHRQLLRAGPDNTRALQSWASQLRTELLQP